MIASANIVGTSKDKTITHMNGALTHAHMPTHMISRMTLPKRCLLPRLPLDKSADMSAWRMKRIYVCIVRYKTLLISAVLIVLNQRPLG